MIWGFLICVNFSCCFWQNSISWFSIVFIDLFFISRYCCISSFRCSLLYVVFSVISLYVLFSAVELFLLCDWKRSSVTALIWTVWAWTFLLKISPDSFEFLCMQFMMFNKLSIVFCLLSSSFLKKGLSWKNLSSVHTLLLCPPELLVRQNYRFDKTEVYLSDAYWCYLLNISNIMVSKRFWLFNCFSRLRKFMNSFHVIRPIIFIAVQGNGINKKWSIFTPFL